MTDLPAGRRGPLQVMFLITSMETGGAEMLLVNLMRRMDPQRCVPQLVCLKQAGELGEQIAAEFPVHSHLIRHRFDATVLGRLGRIMKRSGTDALVTVGAGDKMFWGRLAARRAGVPVILSALHSTGWPDNVGRVNRLLTPITDAFIAVAEPHRDYLIREERFPAARVRLIRNGIDTGHFVADPAAREAWRRRWSIPGEAPLCGIVAALRPEKNHELFLRVAESVSQLIPETHFLIVGDGVQRQNLESLAATLQCRDRIRFTGNSRDVRGALSAMDLFSLTSHNEASPVSILEAMSCRLPVVAPRVGSIDRAVVDGETGYLANAGDHGAFVKLWHRVLADRKRAEELGHAGRRHVLQYGSLASMTEGYMNLIEEVYARKARGLQRRQPPATADAPQSGSPPAIPVAGPGQQGN
jgi:glycosyltransferase involved in cell wall biosynthesis